MSVVSLKRGAALAFAAALLAACSGHGPGALLPTATTSMSGAMAVMNLVPPNCKRQKTTSTYASKTEKMTSAGGTLCVPAFGGFGGSITYPGANPAITLKLTTSTTNYTGSLPKLSKGAPIVYLQFATSGATSFSANAPAGGGLTGKAFVPGTTYTAFGQVNALGSTVPLKPCYARATAGNFGGVVGGLGTLLKGQQAPFQVSGVIEVYKGKRAKAAC